MDQVMGLVITLGHSWFSHRIGRVVNCGVSYGISSVLEWILWLVMESVMGLILQPSIGIFMSWGGDRYKVMVLQKLSFFLAILGRKRKGRIVKGYNHQYDDASPSSLSAIIIMITSGAGVRLVLKSRTWDPAGSLLDTLLWFDHRHSHCCHWLYIVFIAMLVTQFPELVLRQNRHCLTILGGHHGINISSETGDLWGD